MMSEHKPNILFLFTDQLRADCIAALGNSQIKTPNFDRLVKAGTSFTQCYTPSPVCMPARHALTSGAPPHQTGCVDNVKVDCDRSSFMDSLNDLGYHTHGIGKMHFIKDKGDWGFTTREHSEELTGESAQDDYRDYLQENEYGHVRDPHGFRSEYYYLPQPSQLPDKHHNNTWVADRSINFIENRDKSKPFFLWSSFIKPHPPFESPLPWSRLYRMHEMEGPYLPSGFEEQRSFWNRVQCRYKYLDSGCSSHLARMIRAAYYSTISHLDFHLGRILDSLGSEIDNTLIILSADHGEMLGDYGCYGKRTMLDASARIPMVACWPKAFKADATCDNAATLLDLYPTFIEAAGGDVSDKTIEGISLQKVQNDQNQDRYVHSQFSQNHLGLYMVTNREWKYIFSAADDKEWLYHNGQENENLAAQPEHSDILCSLRKQCISRFENDGYNAPLNEGDWHHFSPMELSSDTDDGLIFQDPPSLPQSLKDLGPGYERPAIDKTHDKHNLIRRLVQHSMVEAQDTPNKS